MNAKTLTISIVRSFDLDHWDASNRVAFILAELEINPNRITRQQSAEVERCIAADLQVGK